MQAPNAVKEPQSVAEGAPMSARDRYRGRYSEAYPDLDLDDEEAFYSQANTNLDELESFRKSNKELGEAFDKTPLLAGLVLAAKEGTNPFVYLAENIGPDMDIRELANNPEFAKQMGDALQKFQEKEASRVLAEQEQETENAKVKKELGDNATKSFETLKALQKEKGLSDEACVKMAKDFFGELDEEGNPVGKESFMQLASKGIVTKGMWEALFNARNYDGDVAAAADKARATALNEKVQNPLRKSETGLPQSMPTGGAGRGDRKKKDDGSLSAFQRSLGV